MEASRDSVFIRGLEFEANHGYYEEERRTKRRFRIHAELSCVHDAAAKSDALEDTIDYFVVCETLLKVGTESTFKLLETLAGNMVSALQEHYPRSAIEIEIEKLAPPCPGVPQCCGIRLSRPPRLA